MIELGMVQKKSMMERHGKKQNPWLSWARYKSKKAMMERTWWLLRELTEQCHSLSGHWLIS